MTEDEAKTKWCPFARQTYHEYGAYNREANGAPVGTCMCIGSACMAWRWDPETGGGNCGAAGATTA